LTAVFHQTMINCKRRESELDQTSRYLDDDISRHVVKCMFRWL